MTSEEEKIFDRYRLNEMKWRTNIENLLNNDDRKRELTNAIHFSLGEISNHTYLPSIIMISILLSLLLFILAIVLFTISQKQRKTNLLSITEMIQLKQINASLEEENYQLKIQLTEKDTDLIKINRIIEKKNIEAEEGRARLSTLETEIRDLQAINDQLKSEIEVVAKQKILNTSTDDIDTFIKAFDFISDSLTSFIREYHELFSNTELFSEVQQIDQLISYLEDLFGETRLLSLNAAVESARAGESGKGFGIVADKIREISEKSQNLSKDLKKILRLLTRRLEHETQNKRDNMSKLTAELEELTDYSQEMIKTINTIKNKNHPS
ncbi:MAG TPA: methyl-accepting chemotaxis protein [Thermotogota bacterium]|nr:methyl-accepting chemotaxis protein [Thermotogota bacterium]HPR94786.1 methyl-accepting chemotaxis protein [Thermotogota bacterium]